MKRAYAMSARTIGLGGLLLSALLVQAHALSWPYNNMPSLDSLGGGICDLMGQAALPFASNNFCNGTGFTSPGLLNYRCSILGYAEHTFQSFSKPNATCPAAKQTPAATVSLNGEGNKHHSSALAQAACATRVRSQACQ
jgi:hypothetical protein